MERTKRYDGCETFLRHTLPHTAPDLPKTQVIGYLQDLFEIGDLEGEWQAVDGTLINYQIADSELCEDLVKWVENQRKIEESNEAEHEYGSDYRVANDAVS